MKSIIIRVILLFLIVISPIVLKAQLYGPSLKFGTGYTLLPRGENNYPDYTFLGPGNLYGGVSKYRTLALEYTYYHDYDSYYSGFHYGFTTGIWLENSKNGVLNINTFEKKYEEIISIGIPLLLANKRFAWQNHARFGIIPFMDVKQKASEDFPWNARPYHLDLYFSFGFDNIIKRTRTDGWSWSIEVDSRYNILNHSYKGDLDNQVKLWKMGVKVGIYYQFDWYHYRGWDNNY
jgi:hypothetical protein